MTASTRGWSPISAQCRAALRRVLPARVARNGSLWVPEGKLNLRNDIAATTTLGATTVGSGWHALVLHVIMNGAASTTEVWLDGVKI